MVKAAIDRNSNIEVSFGNENICIENMSYFIAYPLWDF